MKRTLRLSLLVGLLLAACAPTPVTPAPGLTEIRPLPNTPSAAPDYHDAALPVETRVAALLAQMTLAEKIGQMTQVEKGSLAPSDVQTNFIGSVLSGGGGSPRANATAADWAKMTDGFQAYALRTRLAIPLLYGVDAVHGHGNVYGATIFPHNIGLGATRDAELVERIGRATAEELAATGIWWNFAPVVAVPQDIRWGRTYEGFSENTEVVAALGAAYIRGLQGDSLADPLTALATAKHFIGDGGTVWASSRTNNYRLDQGDMQVDEATLRALFLPPYQAALDAGAQSIMVSFSSWNGTKMHAQKYLLAEVLKGELGFTGFLVSDWQAIDQIDPDYYKSVVSAINAGIDMNMVPYEYKRFITTLTDAVNQGEVPLARIDDAVSRILRVKFELGLFEHPKSDPAALALVGSDAHRQLAREAVQKSLVLLTNVNQALPLAADTPVVFVAGDAAQDIGAQCGGWTMEWQGRLGAITPGTTILEGIQQTVAANTTVEFNRFGQFEEVKDAQGQPLIADVGFVVVAEKPYAEGVGDAADLSLEGAALLERVKAQSRKVILVVLSGRPVLITDWVAQADAVVAAWLPGTEGQGVADGLFGVTPFSGKLPYTWPRANSQLPFTFTSLPDTGCAAPLFPFGYGLTTDDPSPVLLECPIQ